MKDIYGLVGKNLDHSFSREFFTNFFEENNIQAEYLNFPLENASEILTLTERHPNLRGLNVTIPYKIDAFKLVDETTAIALDVGAVNCIRVEKGKLIGHNTDVEGFGKSLAQFMIHEKTVNALILGTGGAAAAVHSYLKSLTKTNSVKLVSRKKSSADIMTYNELKNKGLGGYNLIINTTPLGTFPSVNESPDISYDGLNENHYLFDLVYNPEETLFLKEGKKRGAKTINGRRMLEIQALESWKFWNE